MPLSGTTQPHWILDSLTASGRVGGPPWHGGQRDGFELLSSLKRNFGTICDDLAICIHLILYVGSVKIMVRYSLCFLDGFVTTKLPNDGSNEL